MISRYRSLLATPGALGFVVPGFVGRLPGAMRPLGCVLLVSGTSGSYALAGTATAAMTLAQAATAPWLGRLADRNGQRLVLMLSLAVHSLGLGALILAAQLRAPAWALLGAAGIAGASVVPIGSLVRVRWAALADTTANPDSSLRQAYAFEGVLDELLFVVGPPLVTALSLGLFPAAGLLGVLLFVVVGTVGLAANNGPGTSSVRHLAPNGTKVLAVTGMRVLIVVFVALGIYFGPINVALIAFAEERGSPWSAGPLIALFTIGSVVTGLFYGARDWRSRPERRFTLAVAWLLLGTVPILLSPSIPLMALSVTLAGTAIAPATIASSTLIAALLPRAALTEGFAWFVTATSVGGAIGSASGGWIVDHHGARPAFLVASAGAALALTAVLLGTRYLR
nr:MFS transporter [Chloroflexota bacterium]